MKVKIYTLKDPVSNEIRYIGRTKNSLSVRLSGHLNKARNSKVKTYKDCWILSLKSKPIIETLEIIDGWEESYSREIQLIKEYLDKGFRLVNLHDRGEGSLLRNISKEQREKISIKVKQLHDEGKLSCGRKPISLYDLDGNFIIKCRSYKEASEFIGISNKFIENSIRRKAQRIKEFQYSFEDLEKLPKYQKIRRYKTDARIKQGELLENPITVCEDNQQPSLDSNIFEGSTTNLQVQTDNAEDSNENTSALPLNKFKVMI